MSHKLPDVATLLSERIVVRRDFKELVAALERSVALGILAHHKSNQQLDRLLMSGMRFADILSYSSNQDHRNSAYHLVALFQELKEQEQIGKETIPTVDAYSSAILAALGNFPGLNTLEKTVKEVHYALPADRTVARSVKESIQRTADGKYIFTDAQFKAASNARRTDFFSFSGPTSLGKSFIIKDLIKTVVSPDSFVNRSVVFLVPTNALVSQTTRDLRRELASVRGVNVATHPVQPPFMLRTFRASIFVFTPERLIRYLSIANRQVALLVIDEAHRIVSPRDTRSPLFYYAIDQTLRAFAPKAVFSSPYIDNPNLFLDLFEKQIGDSISIRERTVTQQRFFINLNDPEMSYFSSSPSADRVVITEAKEYISSPWHTIEHLANGAKSLIYVNTPGKVVDFALSFETTDRPTLNQRAQNLIKIIEKEIHPDYYLVDALRQGVAFHHGRIPVPIREKIEAVFKDPESGVDFLVCTSTLLEGVNLPARNIFILTDRHGNGQRFKKLDFENLVGRAGRLTEDFKGNIFCIRLNSNDWENPNVIIPPAEPEQVSSFLIEPNKRKKKHYKDIEKILRQEPLPSDRSVPEIESAERYAAILTIQELNHHASRLTKMFAERATAADTTLEKVRSSVDVNLETLRRSPEFDPLLQEHVRKELTLLDSPVIIDSTNEISFEAVLDVLRELSRLYSWKKREARGFNPMFSKKAAPEGHTRRLRYWSLLTFRWITGNPVNSIIQSSINHHKKVGHIFVVSDNSAKDEPRYVKEQFDPDSKKHVNQIINETMMDIEYGVGFRILSYLRNYHDICTQVFGEERAGLNLAVLIEFGTSEQTVVELQQIGFSRDSSDELHTKGRDYLELQEGGSIVGIDSAGIAKDESLSKELKQETSEIFINAQFNDLIPHGEN
ncbi:DEAD/DEAH box helicase [Corynebacterium hadale]|nr:DEAD/DEAH box helicase [Corynebacterium hadale]